MSNQTADGLVEVVEHWRPILLKLDESTVRRKPTPDRWSIAEVIGHLIDSACNNHQRFIRAQEVSELSFPKYDQNHWAAANNYHQAEWSNLVELWCAYNLHLAHVIRNISEGELATPCKITDYDPCTLGYLVEDYLVHLKHHMAKIEERI